MPHIHALDQRRNDFWRGLTKTVLCVLAGAMALVVFVIWRFV